MNRENYADYNFVMPTESSNFASIFTEKDENVNNLHSTDVGIAEVWPNTTAAILTKIC